MTPTHEQLWEWFTPKTMQRLWAKIEMQPGEMDCWLWTGATQDGYGMIYLTIDGKRRALPVHRIMLVLCYAADYPAEHPVARHVVCRNRACCKPSHVRVGTESNNVQDSWNDAALDHRGKKRRKSPYRPIAVSRPVLGADIGPCGSATTM
jgi:hypothetical protein